VSLKFAMLGFLDMEPFSGYDLKKFFDAGVNFYWAATHSQIYRTLGELHDQGLVDIETVPQTDAPNKKVYHITEKGKRELQAWVATPSDLPPVRHELLVKLSWADRLPAARITALLEDYAEKLAARLALYASPERRATIALGRTERERLLWNAILENGVAVYEAERRWALQTIAGIKRLAEDGASGSERGS